MLFSRTRGSSDQDQSLTIRRIPPSVRQPNLGIWAKNSLKSNLFLPVKIHSQYQDPVNMHHKTCPVNMHQS